MSSKINYNSGEKIGECIFISEILQTDDAKNFSRQAIFECSCGKHFESRVSHLKSKWTKSCGCLQHGIVNFSAKYEEIPGRVWTRWKNQAVSRNLIFEITKEQV